MQLERDERLRHHALACDAVRGDGAVGIDRLVELENTVKRAGEHEQQCGGECEWNLEAEFHCGFEGRDARRHPVIDG
ncbi:hypothetical protein, partial [Caballeronia pedi]|uniref:hypothetical protein n=1 Tax=Caballeronia pedi TaxID=1777141 RepID=UPI001AC002C7